MGKELSPSNPTGICEKLLNAFSVYPAFRPIRRIGNPAPTLPVPSTSSDAKILNGQIHEKPIPIKGAQQPDTPEKRKSVEVIPIKSKAPPQPPSLPLTNKKSTTPTASVLENSHVANVALKVKPAPTRVSVEDEKGKPRPKVEMPPPPKAVGQEEEVNRKVKPPPLSAVRTEAASKKEGFKNVNDMATDYIKRTKSRIRRTPPPKAVGQEEEVNRKVKPPPLSAVRTEAASKKEGFKNVNDMATDYIKRTKSRIRRTFTGGRSSSFK